MYKSFIPALAFGLSFIAQSCRAVEATDTNPDPVQKEKARIIELTHDRQAHDTIFHRKSTERFFCDSHLLETTTTLRRDISDENWFFNVDIQSTLNGKEIDLSDYLGKMNDYQSPFDISLQYHCVNSQITIFIHLDQGTRNPFSTRIGDIHIDVDTGEILEEPRKSPKR